MKKSNYKLGILLLLTYCAIYSTSQVATEYYEHIKSAYTLAPYVFFIAILIFLMITFRDRNKIYTLATAHTSLIVKINITTALGWLTIIYALQFIQPAIALMISFGILPAVTVVLSYFNDKVVKPTPVDFVLASLMLIIISITAVMSIFHDWHAIVAIVFCVTAGVANAYNTIYAKILLQNSFNSWQILSARFYIAFILALIICIITHSFLIPSFTDFVVILFIAVTTVVIPAYLIQKGVDLSDAIALSFIVPLAPLITFFLELLSPHIHFSTAQLVLIILMTAMVLAATSYKLRYR